MVERAGGLRLLLEAAQAFGVLGEAAGRTLIATSRQSCVIARPVHLAHPPAPSGARIS